LKTTVFLCVDATLLCSICVYTYAMKQVYVCVV